MDRWNAESVQCPDKTGADKTQLNEFMKNSKMSLAQTDGNRFLKEKQAGRQKRRKEKQEDPAKMAQKEKRKQQLAEEWQDHTSSDEQKQNKIQRV